MINRFARVSSKTWRDDLAEIKAMRKDYNENYQYMTELEKMTYGKLIHDRQESGYKQIATQAIDEYKGVVRKYKYALDDYDAEVRKETNAWDSVKLNAENQLASNRVESIIRDGDQVAKGLKALYQEAVASRDNVKVRAVAEALKGTHAKLTSVDEKILVNGIAKEAEQKVKEIRMTDGMIKAKENQSQAWEAIQLKRAELVDASINLGLGNPTDLYATDEFAKALGLVKRDPYTGEVQILDENDPEITGVDMSKFK